MIPIPHARLVELVFTVDVVDLLEFTLTACVHELSSLFMSREILIRLSAAFACLFGGEDSTFQKLTSNGRAFVHVGGIIIEKRLNNELLRMGTGCVVAFEPSLDFNVARTGG